MSELDSEEKLEPGYGRRNLMVKNLSGLIHLENVDVDYQVGGSNQQVLDHWLPWVHKFISNAKSWIAGMHHGVEAKFLSQYRAEYTFRFNRRHDPHSLFSRALGACVHVKPVKSQVLFG